MNEWIVTDNDEEFYKRNNVPELIRCKDCKWYVHSEGVCKLHSNNYEPSVKMETDDFCSRAKRKEE